MDSNALVGNVLANGSVDPRFVFAVPSVQYYHASVEYRADKWTGTLGMRNIGDKSPPPISFGAYNRVGNGPLYSGYDFYGRLAFANLIFQF